MEEDRVDLGELNDLALENDTIQRMKALLILVAGIQR